MFIISLLFSINTEMMIEAMEDVEEKVRTPMVKSLQKNSKESEVANNPFILCLLI